uniref:Saposin A-type domain-containing protein n=1 Tax=Graphocephala atropunctata TaxID=36148 RepID=A0A1B6LS94_9HEMI
MISLTVLAICAVAVVLGQGPLEVTVFYESHCPACQNFIDDQLAVAHDRFRDKILVDIVPFGNAQQRWEKNKVVISCQHGAKECLGNKLHACAIHQLCGESGTVSCAQEQLTHVINYISCVKKSQDQQQMSNQCALAEGMDPDKLMECATSYQGRNLLSQYGVQTTDFIPRVTYTPYVAINRKHNEAAENNLLRVICELRPEWCSPSAT